MQLSITRLHLRKLRYLFPFVRHTTASVRQLRNANGFAQGYVAFDRKLTFWTVTLWREPATMREYRASGAHLKAMPNLLTWCDEAAVATLEWIERRDLPEPEEAGALLRTKGRSSKVHHPSAAHADGQLWPDGKVATKGRMIAPA